MAQRSPTRMVYYPAVPEVCGCRSYIVHPENNKLLAWTLSGLFLILYEVYMTPFRLCFDVKAAGWEVVWEGCINVSAQLLQLSNSIPSDIWIDDLKMRSWWCSNWT